MGTERKRDFLAEKGGREEGEAGTGTKRLLSPLPLLLILGLIFYLPSPLLPILSLHPCSFCVFSLATHALYPATSVYGHGWPARPTHLAHSAFPPSTSHRAGMAFILILISLSAWFGAEDKTRQAFWQGGTGTFVACRPLSLLALVVRWRVHGLPSKQLTHLWHGHAVNHEHAQTTLGVLRLCPSSSNHKQTSCLNNMLFGILPHFMASGIGLHLVA